MLRCMVCLHFASSKRGRLEKWKMEGALALGNASGYAKCFEGCGEFTMGDDE